MGLIIREFIFIGKIKTFKSETFLLNAYTYEKKEVIWKSLCVQYLGSFIVPQFTIVHYT